MDILVGGAENKTLTITVAGQTLTAMSVEEIEENLNIRYGTSKVLGEYFSVN